MDINTADFKASQHERGLAFATQLFPTQINFKRNKSIKTVSQLRTFLKLNKSHVTVAMPLLSVVVSIFGFIFQGFVRNNV